MKIEGRKSQSIGPIGPFGAPTPVEPPAETPAPAPAEVSVEIASTQQVRQLGQVVRAIPDIRAEMVEGLRDAIEDGNYYVESEKLARAVVDESLAESLAASMQARRSR